MHCGKETVPAGEIPQAFAVSVLLGLRPGDAGGEVLAVVAGELAGAQPERLVHADAGGEQVLYGGFRVTLHRDQAESYYMNLTGERPGAFVICHRDETEGRLEPFLVTLSYDEASSYMEVEDEVHAVPLPPELYRWVEAFVLEHYVPERKFKRKLDSWKGEGRR